LCMAMDHGAHLDFQDGRLVGAWVDRLEPSGAYAKGWQPC
jgi:hypothetical protein